MNPPHRNWRLLPCLSPGCNRYFHNRSGLTKHVRSKHTHTFPVPQPRIRNASPPPRIPDDLVDPLSSPPQAYMDLVPEDDEPDAVTDNNLDVNDFVHDPPDDQPRSTIIMHPYLTGKLVSCTIESLLIILSYRKAM
jgi:hypothetical protein